VSGIQTCPAIFIVPMPAEGRLVSDWHLRDVADLLDAILVIHRWSPAWVIPMLQCRGVVILGGAPTSHPAIIARELALPSCLVAREDWPSLESARVNLSPEAGVVRWQ